MDETQGRFIILLKQEIAALEELHVLLKNELLALKERDSDQVSLMAKQKNELLNKVGMLDKQRQLYIEDDTHLIYTDNVFSENINILSNKIETCLDKCRHQNNINGGVIEMSMLFNKKILDIVCGNDEKDLVYSAEGKNSTHNYQHSLARV